MQNLIKQEQFEIEVLDRLNNKRLLNHLIFCGGTMLRLCHGLNRFSVDLDFWLLKDVDVNMLFNTVKESLGQFYTLSDVENKFHTLLYEIRSKKYPRSLKVEIRKEIKKVNAEKVIAYSKYATTQVLLNAVSLNNMMTAKIEALTRRKEIRDIFDIEFLLKKGIELPDNAETLKSISDAIETLKKRDYTVKLGSLLEDEQRKYYISEDFKILKLAIKEKENR